MLFSITDSFLSEISSSPGPIRETYLFLHCPAFMPWAIAEVYGRSSLS